MIIAITGTPATGKTTLAGKLRKELGYPVLDLNDLIEEYKDVVLEYDTERETKIIDEGALLAYLVDYLSDKQDLIIDSHLSHYLSPKYLDVVVVVTCDLSTLRRRLAERGYNELKIKENLEAEAFDTILDEAYDEGHAVIPVDATKRTDVAALAVKIKKKKKTETTLS